MNKAETQASKTKKDEADSVPPETFEEYLTKHPELEEKLKEPLWK